MPDPIFEQPQRQAVWGIILIFFQNAYKFLRAFWPFLLLAFFSSSVQIRLYAALSLPIIAGLGVVYSYIYYRNFVFFIDYQQKEFVLNKGVFSSESIRIPFDKIQQVDLKRSILQRFIGVYGLTIDTAGSKKDEIQIHALPKTDALRISEILTKLKDAAEIHDNAETEQTEEGKSTEKASTLWKHHASLGTLLKVGLTKSYLRGFALIFAFAATIFNQIENYFQEYMPSENEFDNFFQNLSGSLLITFTFIFFLFALSILVTIGEVFIKHWDLSIRQNARQIQIEMGLKTNTKVSFRAQKLQLLKILTNPIQKKLNLYEAHFFLASSENELGKSKIIAPGLGKNIIDKIQSFLYPDTFEKTTKNHRPHPTWLNRRWIVITLIISVFWLINYLSPEQPNLRIMLSLTILVLAILIPYQIYLYRSISLKMSEDFLFIQQGLWTRKLEILELYKMEGISIHQPFWYKRRKLISLTFHTAGGDLKIRAMSEDFRKEINYILYKVESSQTAWM